MGADEEGTHAALTALRREVADAKIAEYRGRIVETTGDGLLVEFASIVDAVRCAVEWKRAMAMRNVSHERRVAFRIGINLGEVIIDDEDIYGDGVNVAARLEASAEPGGICVSRVVRDQRQAQFRVRGQEHSTPDTRLPHPDRRKSRPVSVTGVAREAVARGPTVSEHDW